MISPRPLKLILLVAALLIIATSIQFNERPTHARSTAAPPASRTGAPAFGAVTAEQNCTACHTTNPVNTGDGKVEILDVPANYVPGQEYTLRVVASRPTSTKFGFQLTALDPTGNKAGEFANISTTRTAIIAAATHSGTTRQYIHHAVAPDGTNATATDKSEWSFKWTAPATKVGKIGFYAAGNTTNSSGNNQGDFVYTTSVISRPAIETINAASYDKTVPFMSTPGGIVSGFGEDITPNTAIASGDADPNTPGIQLPTTLGDVTIKVKDSLNVERNAGLFYVSPTQVNYMIPDGTSNGVATVTITSGTGGSAITSTGTITIADVKPGIFTMAQNGSGLAAAEIQRVRNGQTIGFEPIVMGTTANPVAIPIEWKDPNDVLYLVLYSTGLRRRSQLSNVTAMIGGGAQLVVYADTQGTYAGLDQVNVQLNRNLATRGEVDVVLTVDGKAANTVKANFK